MDFIGGIQMVEIARNNLSRPTERLSVLEAFDDARYDSRWHISRPWLLFPTLMLRPRKRRFVLRPDTCVDFGD